MKNPNGFGSIAKLSGNRRKPYIVRVTTGYEFNKEKDKVEQKRLIVGYARTKAEALELLTNIIKRRLIQENVIQRLKKCLIGGIQNTRRETLREVPDSPMSQL